jgi:hypothetical protein
LETWKIALRTYVRLESVVISRACPVIAVLTFAFVRTGLRGKPNQLNSLSPPCEMVEGGSKASYEKE